MAADQFIFVTQAFFIPAPECPEQFSVLFPGDDGTDGLIAGTGFTDQPARHKGDCTGGDDNEYGS